MEFESVIFRFDGDLWYYAIGVPSEIAISFIDGDNRRVLCTVEDKITFHAALMHNGQGGYFINLNKERRSKLGLIIGQKISVKLEKDHSEFGYPMSEEFKEVLDQDDDARFVFESLTKGKQRSLIYWVDNVKSSEIKIRRALVLMNHLTSNSVLDFKTLNKEIKEANRQASRK